jgi:hypothetical protein
LHEALNGGLDESKPGSWPQAKDLAQRFPIFLCVSASLW